MKETFKITKKTSVYRQSRTTGFIRDSNGRYISFSEPDELVLRELQKDDKSFLFHIENYEGIERDRQSKFYQMPVRTVAFETVFENKLYIGHEDNKTVKLIEGKVDERRNIVIESGSHNLFHCIQNGTYSNFEVADATYSGYYLASDGKKLYIKKKTEDLDSEIKFYVVVQQQLDDLALAPGCCAALRNCFK